MRRLMLTLIATTVASALVTAQANAASTYCAPSGDYCYSAKRERGTVVLRFDTFSFSNPVRTCVRSPGGARDCRTFKLSKRKHGLRGFTRRWTKHFPKRGKGTYKVTFGAFGNTLGPGATFRI